MPKRAEEGVPRLVSTEIPAGPDLWKTIEPVWTSVLNRTGETSAFMSAPWVRLWLETFGAELETNAIVWSTPAGDAVACALISRGKGRVGPFRVSRVFLNASGEDQVGCEHNDVLVLPEYRGDVVHDLTRVFRAQPQDELALLGIRKRLFDELVASWSGRPWNGRVSESPYVDLAAIRRSGGDYLATLSSNKRSQIRRSIRLYEERFGTMSVEFAQSADQALTWFEELVTLHEERWRAEGVAGAFHAVAKRFHTTLIERVFGDEGDGGLGIDIVRVRFGETTIGVLYNLVCRGCVHFYQSGLNYHDDARLKPGFVTHTLTIERCIRRGDEEYDFLGGEPRPVRYKRSLSTDRRTLYWAELRAPGPKMALIQLIHRFHRSHTGPGAETAD